MKPKVRILYNDLWPTITKLAKKSKCRHVAVAYLGKGANRLLPLRKGDVLIADMSIDAVKNGQTNPFEVERYLRKGVNAYTCANLHAKMYIFDRTLLVGSANVSLNSKNNLLEAGLICQDNPIVTQARGWMKSLQTETVTPEYINLCKSIYNPPKFHAGFVKGKKGTVAPLHSRLWILSTSPAEFSEEEETLRDAGEKRALKKIKDTRKYEISSIRWTGESRVSKRIREGDLAIQVWSANGKKEVYPPSRVLLLTHYKSFDQKKTPFVLIHLEESCNPRILAWVDFRKKVRKAGIRNLGLNPQREIRPNQMAHRILGIWS